MLAEFLDSSIKAIHESKFKLVYEFTGAGSLALFWLHNVPGSSATVLEATDRYCPQSLAQLLGSSPEKSVAEETAVLMSQRAFLRACFLLENHAMKMAENLSPGALPALPLGIACTAAIATSRDRRGANQCFVAVQTNQGGAVYNIVLEKGKRNRTEEEKLVSHLVIASISEACNVEPKCPTLALGANDTLKSRPI